MEPLLAKNPGATLAGAPGTSFLPPSAGHRHLPWLMAATLYHHVTTSPYLCPVSAPPRTPGTTLMTSSGLAHTPGDLLLKGGSVTWGHCPAPSWRHCVSPLLWFLSRQKVLCYRWPPGGDADLRQACLRWRSCTAGPGPVPHPHCPSSTEHCDDHMSRARPRCSGHQITFEVRPLLASLSGTSRALTGVWGIMDMS